MKQIRTFLYNLRETGIEDIEIMINKWLEVNNNYVCDVNTMMFNRNGGYDCFICYSITYETEDLKPKLEELIKENERMKHQLKTIVNNQEDRPIESLGFSTRIFNCLKRAGINNNKDLLKRYYDGTLTHDKIRNLGKSNEELVINKVRSDLLGYE